MNSRIAIVGFSGAGKSVLGAKLAKLINYDFVDLDSAIEEKYRTTIAILFKKYGEPAFRKCEYAVLQEVLERENCVVATGGGAPCYKDAMDLINSRSISIFLDLDEEIIVKNLLTSKKNRPLTSKYEEPALRLYVRETLAQRSPFYQEAHLVVHSDDGNFDENIVADLLRKFN